MNDKRYLRSLLEYNGWANGELYAKVAELPPEEVTKKRKTGLESIHLSLNHLLAVDRIWHAHMEGRAHGYESLRPVLYAEFDALRDARRETDGVLIDYLDSLDAAALEEVVEYELIGGNKGALSRAMCFTHLIVHGAYHRGWIADMFGQADSRPPIIDIPVFERAVRDGGFAPLP